jgi:hypothetical protein
MSYYYTPLGALPASGLSVLFGEPPTQHFFPLPLWQHFMAPPSLLHIFASFLSQHFMSQPFLQHLSPLHVPFLAIGQFAPIAGGGAWAKVKAAKMKRNERNEIVRFMEISLTLKKQVTNRASRL